MPYLVSPFDRAVTRRRSPRGSRRDERMTVTGSIDLANYICIGVDVGGPSPTPCSRRPVDIWRAKSPTTPGDLGAGVLAARGSPPSGPGDPRVAAARGPPLRSRHDRRHQRARVTAAVDGSGSSPRKGFEDMVPLAGAPGRRRRRLARPAADDRRRRDASSASTSASTATATSSAARRRRGRRRGHARSSSERRRGGRGLVPLVVPRTRRTSSAAIAVSATRSRTSRWSRRRSPPRDARVRAHDLRPAERLRVGALGGHRAARPRSRALGLRVPLLLVHSAGGSISVDEARACRSGWRCRAPRRGRVPPVAVGAAQLGIDDVVTCDMGGTSLRRRRDRRRGARARRTRGRSLGVWTTLPQIDVESIGAGGGSLGWVDTRGDAAGRTAVGRRRSRARPATDVAAPSRPSPTRLWCWASSTRSGSSAATWRSTPPPRRRPVRGSASRRPRRRRDGVGHPRACAGRHGPGRRAGCSPGPRPPRADALPSAAAVRCSRPRSRPPSARRGPRPRAGFGPLGFRRRDGRRPARAVPGRSSPTVPARSDPLVEKDRRGAPARDRSTPTSTTDGVTEPRTGAWKFEADLRFTKPERRSSRSRSRPGRCPPPRSSSSVAKLPRRVCEALRPRLHRVGARRSSGLPPRRRHRPNPQGHDRRHGSAGSRSGQGLAAGGAAGGVGRSWCRRPTGRRRHRGDDLHPGQTLQGPALVDGTDTTIWVPEATSLRVSPHGTLIVEVGT